MIHQFKNNGFAFVVDTASGAVHSVDDVAYDVIALYGDHDEDGIVRQITEKYGIDGDEVKECLADVRELVDRGLLFSEDEFRDLPPKNGKSTVKALCLHVAHTCNLNCEYCFASQGKYNKSASRGKPALMSFEVGRQAIDFLIENSPGRRNLEVDFFGGEPLMNWEVVKEIVAYARSVEKEAGKNFRFTLTTNGVLLDDEVTDFLNREMHNVVLSLDGRREVHDRFRKTYAGEGSYDTVVPKFQRFVGRRGGRGYYVRGTFTHLNTDFLEDIKHMASLGFRELSMEPVVCAPGDPYALTEEDLPVLFEQYDALAAEMLRREREGLEKYGSGFTYDGSYEYIDSDFEPENYRVFGKAQRPDFDVGVLTQLPCRDISFVRDVTEKLWSEKEKRLYGATPLYMLRAVRL